MRNAEINLQIDVQWVYPHAIINSIPPDTTNLHFCGKNFRIIIVFPRK